jgi:gas vesicle protein
MAVNDSDSDSKFAIGFIVGIMTGLAIAILIAPKSGDETRKLIREKVVDVGGRVINIADDIDGIAKEVAGDRKKIYSETWKKPKVKPYSKEL